MTQKTMISLLIPAEQGISARDTFDTDCVARHFPLLFRSDRFRPKPAPSIVVIPDLIRDPFTQRRNNGSRIKSGMTKENKSAIGRLRTLPLANNTNRSSAFAVARCAGLLISAS